MIDKASRIALDNIKRDLDGLSVDMIWPMLKEILYDVVLYVGGATLGGGMLGAGIGAFGAGVGAIPGAAVGASLGAKAGLLITQWIGIAMVAEYMVKAVPDALRDYMLGLENAWGKPIGLYTSHILQNRNQYKK